MKLKEIFDQSDTIIEPWPDYEANCFRVGGPCRSAFKIKTDFTPGKERVKLNVIVHGRKWLIFFTGMKRVKGNTDFTPGKETVKLNVIVHGSKWLTFFTGMKRVKGKTDFTPGKERVKLNVVVHGSKWLTFFTGMKRVKS